MDNFSSQPNQTTPFQASSAFANEIISERESIGVPWRILIMSMVLFGLSLFVYFGLRFGYESYLEVRAENIDKEMEGLSTKVSETDQARLVNFYSQLVNLSKVLDRHIFPANMFSFLERNTLGTVYYLQADYRNEEGVLILQGQAATPETVTNQMAAFEKSPSVSRVVLNDLSTSKLGSQFNLSVVLDPVYFNDPR